jgi:hypothetical protein
VQQLAAPASPSGRARCSRRAVASSAVIAGLVALNYLKEANRHRDSAIKRAIERLRRDLYRAGVIQTGDVSLIEAQATPPHHEPGSIAADRPTTGGSDELEMPKRCLTPPDGCHEMVGG